MAEVDLEKVRGLADNAQQRAMTAHKAYDEMRAIPSEVRIGQRNTGRHWEAMKLAASHLNDYFYWIGHANAYKGIIAMAELASVVEDEMDSEPQCP